jgi:hypothetical protein
MTPADYLLKDYDLKVRYLTDHFSRMWTRFNFFLAINSALFASSMNKDNACHAWLLVALGFAFSLVWNQFGATDNYLVDLYRKQVALAHYLLREALNKEEIILPGTQSELETFSYAGDNTRGHFYNLSERRIESVKQGFWQRRWKNVSVTELAIIFSTLFAVAWFLRFLTWIIGGA